MDKLFVNGKDFAFNKTDYSSPEISADVARLKRNYKETIRQIIQAPPSEITFTI